MIVMGVSMSILFISSIALGVVIPLTRPKINVTFHPSDMISYPGHTAWLLADVQSEEPIDIEVGTNVEVQVEWKTWSTCASSYLVEIFLKPNSQHVDNEIRVNLLASTESRRFSIGSCTIDVINWTSCAMDSSVVIRDHFLQYIESNTTFSNINSSTEWNFCGSPAQILIVEHCLFQSEFWEIEISRHVMISPHDWAQTYIRPRNQTSPIWSAKIDSWSLDNSSIYEIDSPSEIFR